MTDALPPLPYSPRPTLPEKSTRQPRQPKGCQSKQETLKEAILLAGAYVGDEFAAAALEKGEERPGGLMGYLTMVAAHDVKSFCALLGRVLPMTLAGDGKDGGIVIEIVKRTYGNDPTPA